MTSNVPPIHAALETIIRRLEALKRRMPFWSERDFETYEPNQMADRCIDIVREELSKQPGDVVERVARIFQDGTTNYPGAKLSKRSMDTAKAAIAAMQEQNMDYAGGQPERHISAPSDAGITTPDRQGDALIAEPPAPVMQGCTADGLHKPDAEGATPSPCDQQREISLDKCVNAALTARAYYDDMYAITKAVLDAAGVKYVD